MTTTAAWLDGRDPPAPPGLRNRLLELLPSDLPAVSGIPVELLRAGQGLLITLLDGDCASRSAALDLLAADALVTYAFEVAADEPQSLDGHASAAMRMIAAAVAGER